MWWWLFAALAGLLTLVAAGAALERFSSWTAAVRMSLKRVTRPAGPAFNVVFVHGLGGHWFRTWSNLGPECDEFSDEDITDPHFWPTMVGASFPQAAVHSLEYPASPTNWSGTVMTLDERSQAVLDLFKRSGLFRLPTFFVCHSLGGLILKKVWQLGYDDPLLRASMQGIAFVATPHKGSQIASMLRGCTDACGCFDAARPSDVVPPLEIDDASMMRLYEWYRQHPAPYTCAYYETQVPLSFEALTIVDRDSADPGIGAKPVPVDAGHGSICKPGLKDAPIVVSVNRDIEQAVVHRVTNSPSPTAAAAAFESH